MTRATNVTSNYVLGEYTSTVIILLEATKKL